MTTVVFESAALADCVKSAALVAPTKGQAFDAAHGILVEVSPHEDPPVAMRATDLSVFYTEWVNALEVSGDPVIWRVPSAPLGRIAAALPMKAGSTVTFREDKGKLLITSGKMRATLNNLPLDNYPTWDVFEPTGLYAVQAFGQALKRVGWASSKEPGAAHNGIHLNGKVMVATDRYRMAQVPFELDLPKPITIPTGILNGLIGDLTESSVAVREHNFLIMPDTHTQIKTGLNGLDYPPFERVQFREFENFAMVHRDDFADLINRCLAIGTDDRIPLLRMWLGKQELACMMENGEKGRLGDVIDLPNQADHDRIELKFNPQFLLDTIRSCPNEIVRIGYNNKEKNKLIYVDGGSGYEAWVMPIRGVGEQS